MPANARQACVSRSATFGKHLLGKAAALLQVSVRTVEGHRRKVLSKMLASSAAQLVGTVLDTRKAIPAHVTNL